MLPPWPTADVAAARRFPGTAGILAGPHHPGVVRDRVATANTTHGGPQPDPGTAGILAGLRAAVIVVQSTTTLPRAPKRPRRRVFAQAGNNGIGFDIGDSRTEVALVADSPVEVFALPERAVTPQHLVGDRRRVRLPGVRYRGQGMSVQGRTDDMHVIGHDDPGVQPVALSVEVQQRLFHMPRHAPIAQPARTMAGIEIALDAPPVLRVRFALGQPGQFVTPGLHNPPGQRVGQAKRDGLWYLFALEVRQIAA